MESDNKKLNDLYQCIEEYQDLLFVLKKWLEEDPDIRIQKDNTDPFLEYSMRGQDKKLMGVYFSILGNEQLLHDTKKSLVERPDNSIDYQLELIDEGKSELGWALLECGRYEMGLTVHQLISTDCEMKYLGLGRALIETWRLAEAEVILGKGLEKFPDSVSLLIAMGNLYKKIGDDGRALKFIDMDLIEDAFYIAREELRQCPSEEPQRYLNAGVAYVELGGPDDADEIDDMGPKKFVDN